MTIKIKQQNLGGFGANSKLIQHITFWSKEMSTDAEMFFYSKDPNFVVDFSLNNPDTMTIFFYPHNRNEKDLMVLATKFADEIFKLGEQNFTITKSLDFTVALSPDGPTLLQVTDFDGYGPAGEFKDSLFIFQDEDFGFPNIYCVNATQQTYPHSAMMSVMARSSHVCTKSVSQTPIGKAFTTMIVHSFMTGKFEREVPNVQGMSFPTSERIGVSPTVNTEKLRDFLDATITDKLKVNPNGEIVENKAADAPVADLSVNDPAEVVQKRIWESVVEKASIAFSDLLQYGLSETKDLLGNSETYIDVHIDLQDLVKKMCYLQGKFHFIPSSQDSYALDFFGESEEILVEDTIETFPAPF
jgi:hypothetical protein